MPGPHMTLAELAEELGRSADWLSRNWPRAVKAKTIPPPLHASPPLIWSRAQVHAHLDRGMPAEMRAMAAAYRAAYAAAAEQPITPRAALDDTKWEQHLNARYAEGV